MLYQLITPSDVACDLASRGLQPRQVSRRLYLDWWSNSPLVTPNRLLHFLFKVKQSLLENFSVNFMVRDYTSVLCLIVILGVPCGVYIT